MRLKHAVETLRKRSDYLARRISGENPERPLTFDRAEFSALQIAIRELQSRHELNKAIESERGIEIGS